MAATSKGTTSLNADELNKLATLFGTLMDELQTSGVRYLEDWTGSTPMFAGGWSPGEGGGSGATKMLAPGNTNPTLDGLTNAQSVVDEGEVLVGTATNAANWLYQTFTTARQNVVSTIAALSGTDSDVALTAQQLAKLMSSTISAVQDPSSSGDPGGSGDPTAGDPTSGDPTSGDPTSGDPGPSGS